MQKSRKHKFSRRFDRKRRKSTLRFGLNLATEDFVEDRGSYKRLSAMGVKKFVQLEAGTLADGGSDRRSQLDTILESASTPQRPPGSSQSDKFGGFFNRAAGARSTHAPSPAHSDNRDHPSGANQDLADLCKEREAFKKEQHDAKSLLAQIRQETAKLRAL